VIWPDDFINKIIPGDCLEVMKEMPDKCIDLVLTDIPYNIPRLPEQGLRKINKDDANCLTFDLEILLFQLNRVCTGTFYIFCDWSQVSLIRQFFKKENISDRYIIWEKTNPSPMNGQYLWLSGIEVCCYGKKPKGAFCGYCRNTVLRHPSGNSHFHPTEKPLDLFIDLVRTSSDEGQLVFDPFLGSGTTAEACKLLHRDFIGIEINPDYCKIAEERLAQGVL